MFLDTNLCKVSTSIVAPPFPGNHDLRKFESTQPDDAHASSRFTVFQV